MSIVCNTNSIVITDSFICNLCCLEMVSKAQNTLTKKNQPCYFVVNMFSSNKEHGYFKFIYAFEWQICCMHRIYNIILDGDLQRKRRVTCIKKETNTGETTAIVSI